MSMREFTYQALPVRVVFGPGRASALPEEVDRLGLRRVLVLCTPGHRDLAAQVAEPLGDRVVAIHAKARTHVPAEVAEQAVRVARDSGADGCVAVGGGSTVGLGKAIALRDGLPVVAVPTTYSGSEMTQVWGLTTDGEKRTGKDPRVLPRTVIYDPELTVSLPPELSVTSGLNAVAHAVEALYAPDASPVISLLAEEAVRAVATALPAIVADPRDIAARGEALYGSWLCGCCLGATTMSLHHKLCHALGGNFDLPHAETHAVVLPHALAYNAPAAPDAVAALGRALRAEDPARELFELAARLGAPKSLAAIGFPADGVERVVELVTANPYANPREVTADGVREVVRHALEGSPPSSA